MREEKKVSIIVPVFNVERYLSRCLNSLINQTYENIEIILVNDGSTDNSAEICKKCQENDERIILIEQENKGLSAARNAGIVAATGDYISFVDSDDWVELDFIGFGMNIISSSGCEICVMGSFDSNDIIDRFSQSGWIDKQYVEYDSLTAIKKLVEDVEIKSHAWDKIYSRTVFDGTRFPFGKNYEDIYIMHELFLKANRISVSKQPKYHYFVRDDSIARNYRTKNILDYFDAHFARLDFLEKHDSDCVSLEHTKLMELLLSYYPKFKKKGVRQGEDYKEQKRAFGRYCGKIIDLYSKQHDAFTEEKYKYMYRLFVFGKNMFRFFAPIANDLLRFIKKTSLKDRIKKHLYKDKVFLKKLKHVSGPLVYLIGVPEYDNLGDVAIGYAEEKLLFDTLGSKEKYIVVTERNFWKYLPYLRRVITQRDLIIIQGGGNFGNQYPDQEKIRRKILCCFKCETIIMPSTFYLLNEDFSAAKYCRHYRDNKLTLFAREKYSLIKMKKHFKCNCDLTPDIVLGLECKNDCLNREGFALCLRNDVESNVSAMEKNEIKKMVFKLSKYLYSFDTCVGHQIPYIKRDYYLQKCMNDISKYECVITDKLHAMIFCYLTNTPCVVLGNYNYKVKGVFEWIEGKGNILFAKEPGEIPQLLNVVMKDKKESETLKEEFAVLRETIKELFNEEIY